MVLKPKSKGLLAAVLLLVLSVFSCEKQFFVIVDCEECTASEPQLASILVRVGSDSPSGTVTVRIHEGTNTDAPVIITYQAQTGDERTITAALNRTYTAVAEYRYAGKTYRVVNSVRPSVKFAKSDCEEECYYVYNTTLNLILKYL